MNDDRDTDEEGATPLQKFLERVGFVFTIAWIGILIFGVNQNWLKQVPLVGLIMLLIGFILARHFVVDQLLHCLSVAFQFLLTRSKNSTLDFFLLVAVSALGGGGVGWGLAISYTTQTIAGCSAAGGAVLFALLAIEARRQYKQIPADSDNSTINDDR